MQTGDVEMVTPEQAWRYAEEEEEALEDYQRTLDTMEGEVNNGRWAMVGFFAALIGEKITGKGIIGQLSLYVFGLSNAVKEFSAAVDAAEAANAAEAVANHIS